MAFYNTSEINLLMERHGFSFLKSMGQNFIIDRNIPEKLVRLSGIDNNFTVLEVGPGLGPLTEYLCQTAKKVIAVELDRRLIPLLSETLTDYDNCLVIQGDILKFDIPTLLREHSSAPPYAVCANLPYNITSPAIAAFIDAKIFDSITVMIQRETARRICAKPGTPEYGAFTVYVNYHATPRLLFDVPPECFMPRPKVHSSVLTMAVNKEREVMPKSEAMFFRTVRASFAQRRKTLLNALNASFGGDFEKSGLSDIISSCGFDTRVRGETLDIPDFIKLSDALFR